MDYTYKIGDNVYLKPLADSRYNIEKDRGREVTIIDIDKFDPFIPFRIKTVRGYTYWTTLQAIEGYFKPLGLRV